MEEVHRKALWLDACQDEMIRMFGLHFDSIAMEMEVDDGTRKMSLHSVGSAEAVSPLRKVEPRRITVMRRPAFSICAVSPFLETQLRRQAISDNWTDMLWSSWLSRGQMEAQCNPSLYLTQRIVLSNPQVFDARKILLFETISIRWELVPRFQIFGDFHHFCSKDHES